MPKGYWFGSLDVNDTDKYGAYQRFVRPFLAANGGRFLIRGGQNHVVEGKVRSRIILVEFPSYDDALRVYRSAEYQEGMKLRLGVAVNDLAIVEGFDG
jgi:uncharacterized protein (DUF1330 family)